MKNLLQLNFSPREESNSTNVAKYLVKKLTEKEDLNIKVKELDLVPFVNNIHTTSFFTPKEYLSESQADSLLDSNSIIKAFKEADIIVLAYPMYNLNIPANVKAYIDQLVRINETFSIDEKGVYHGLLVNKQVYTVMATGGTPLKAPMDFATPYINSILGLIGITDVSNFAIPFNQFTDDLNVVLKRVYSEVNELLQN
jgi:FMN-dependent NADH-azoreductase